MKAQESATATANFGDPMGGLFKAIPGIVEIFKGGADFSLGVHDKRSVLDDGFIERTATNDHKTKASAVTLSLSVVGFGDNVVAGTKNNGLEGLDGFSRQLTAAAQHKSKDVIVFGGILRRGSLDEAGRSVVVRCIPGEWCRRASR